MGAMPDGGMGPPKIEYPEYLVRDRIGKRAFVSRTEAIAALKRKDNPCEMLELVLEADHSVRSMTQEERDRIVELLGKK